MLTHPGSQFDICDTRGNHFAQEVPKRAITCPILLNAIFAVSSRLLSLFGQFDQYAADRYHQECLRHLATISAHGADLDNDYLLAAAVLLRDLEEVEGILNLGTHFTQKILIHL